MAIIAYPTVETVTIGFGFSRNSPEGVPPEDRPRIPIVVFSWSDKEVLLKVWETLKSLGLKEKELKAFMVYDPPYVSGGENYVDIIVKVDATRGEHRHILIGEAEFRKKYAEEEFLPRVRENGFFALTLGLKDGAEIKNLSHLWKMYSRHFTEVPSGTAPPEEISAPIKKQRYEIHKGNGHNKN